MTTGFGIVPAHLRGQVTAYEIAVYVVLTWRADERGECWPSHTVIATEAGCSVASVRRALDGLRDKGVVTWEARYFPGEGGQTSNVYRLTVYRNARVREQGGSSARAGGLLSESDELDPEELDPEEETPPAPEHGAQDQPDPWRESGLDPADDELVAVPDFALFWRHYPRKVGKRAAGKAWAAATARAGPQQIVDAVRALAADPNLPERQFVPHPATWLNRDGWEDEPQPPRGRMAQNLAVVAALEAENRLALEE